MNERETAEKIEDRAAEWVARSDRLADDLAVQAELDAWLIGDDRRRGAYFRALAAWHMLDRASVLGAGARGDVPDDAAAKPRRRSLWGRGLVAASLAIAAVVGFGLRTPGPVLVETAVGEIRRVPLDEGSLVEMNTDTRVAISLKPRAREVAIERGEAWFQVAKDGARPFVVDAGEVRVRAVGTAFSVRRMEGGADVQVTEGTVEVWSAGKPGNVRRLSVGSRAFVDAENGAGAVTEGRADIDRRLAWRTGQLIFDGTTLGEAAAEFNRYNKVQVRIAGAELAGEKLVGRFRAREPEAFAKAAAAMLGARVTKSEDEIRIAAE